MAGFVIFEGVAHLTDSLIKYWSELIMRPVMLKKAKVIQQKVDNLFVPIMKRLGHRTERYLLAFVFFWFGTLKLIGETSATSIVAKSIYWFQPDIVVPLLGIWEILMGVFLAFHLTLRFAIFLLFVRLPGTFLALFYHFDECFSGSLLYPTIQGQYLIKELTLVGAALVIGSTIKSEATARRI